MNKITCAAALIFLISLAVYCVTLSPSLSSQSDSGELVTAASTAGIAHPPGYPLYTMTGLLFSFFPARDKAFRLNLMSALFSSLALVLVFLTALRIMDDFYAAMTASLSLAFSRSFWSLSLSAEVFSMHMAFVALLLSLLLWWRACLDRGKGDFRAACLFFLCAGLSLAHHHTILLLFPGYLYLITAWRLHQSLRAPRRILAVVLLFVAGLVPYLYLPLRAMANPPLNWGDPDSIRSFVRVVTREGYGTFSLARMVSGPPDRESWALFFQILPSQFLIPFLLFLPAGAVLLWKKERHLLLFLIWTAAVSGPLFAMVASFPRHEAYTAVLERFFLPAYMACALLCGCGISLVTKKIPGLSPAFLIMPLIAALLYCPFVIRRHDYSAADYGVNLLKSVDRNALIFVQGDVASGSLLYCQHVAGARKDVTVLFEGLLTSEWYMRQVAERHRDLAFLAECSSCDRRAVMMTVIDRMREVRPLYLNHYVDDPAVTVECRGLAFQIVRSREGTTAEKCAVLQDLLEHQYCYRGSYRPGNACFFTREIFSLYSGAWYFLALSWKDIHHWEKMEHAAIRALEYSPVNTEALLVRADAESSLERWDDARKSYLEVLARKGDSPEVLTALAVTYARMGDHERARETLSKARALRR